MCCKAVSTYPYIIEFPPDQFKASELCDKAVDTCPFVFVSVSDRYITEY